MTTDAPDPAAVIAAFGLPGPVTGWEPVGGAWSNRVYRLDAGGRHYAVKEMRNPWGEPRWQEWLAESWSFEQQAIAAGVARTIVPGLLAAIPAQAAAAARISL